VHASVRSGLWTALLAAAGLTAFILWPVGATGFGSFGGPGGKPLQKVTYAVATADLNVGYPFATLPAGLGYFKQEGLDVNVVPGQSSASVIQLLVSGRADVGVVIPDPAITQRANNGVPLVSVYAVSRRAGGGLAVREDSDIHDLPDLKGSNIGTPDYGGGGYYALQRDLEDAGLSMDQVHLIATGYGTPGYEALARGKVAASQFFTAAYVRAQLAGYKFRLLPKSDADTNKYNYNIYARADFIKKHPDIIIGIGRATAKATVFLKENPEAGVKMFWKQYPDRAPKDPNDKTALHNDLALIRGEMYDMATDAHPFDFAWGSQDADQFAKLEKNLEDGGIVKKHVDPNQLFTSAYAPRYTNFDVEAVRAQARAFGQTSAKGAS
jgi:NitT/TauT family transport system substrate-binding protein